MFFKHIDSQENEPRAKSPHFSLKADCPGCPMQQHRNLSPFLGIVVFLYFLTLSADQLHIQLFLFKPKISHLIALFLLALLLFTRRLRTPDSRWTLGFAGVFFSMCLSSLFSPFFSRSLGYIAVGIFTWAVYFLIPFSLMKTFCREQLLRLYFASFFTIGAHATLQLLLSLFQIYDPFLLQMPIWENLSRGQSWTYEPSYYALYAIPFVFFMTTQHLSGKKNLFPFLTSHGFLLISISTSAFFSYLFFLPTAFFFSSKQIGLPLFRKNLRKFLFRLTAFFLLLGLFFQELFQTTFYKFFNADFFSHISFAARWKGITDAWDVFLAHPFFGLGIGGVGPSLYIEEQLGSAPIKIYNPTLEIIELHDPTNVLTEVMASLGGFGLLIFMGMGILFVHQFSVAIRRAQDPLVREKLLAFFLSSIIMIICLQINQGLFRSYVWVHIAMALGYTHSTSLTPRRTELKAPAIELLLKK